MMSSRKPRSEARVSRTDRFAQVGDGSPKMTAGYLRQEWSWAIRRLPDYTGLANQTFIIPVLIDDVDFRNAEIPGEFKDLHYESLRSGEPIDEFCKSIQSFYRELKSAKKS
jgi:hypothetical protein